MRAPWSDIDEGRLREFLLDGYTIGSAGTALGRSYQAVQNKCYELGIRLSRKRYARTRQCNSLMIWSEDNIAKLKAGIKANLRRQTIAEDIIGPPATKNAVIGKAHRLGLCDKPTPPRHYPFADLLDAEKTNGHRCCRWPIGHPEEAGFHFCSAPVESFGPYCTTHHEEAYPKRPTPGETTPAD